MIAVILLLTLAKFYVPNSKLISKEGLKIASINLLSSNQEYDKVIDFIEEGGFNVVFFQELNDIWVNKMTVLEKDFPYQMMISRSDNFGIGVMSRFEFSELKNIDLSNVEIPSILIKFVYQGNELSILGTHPLPPMGNQYFESRNEQFKSINEFVQSVDPELIVIGDLNSTNFSQNFDLLLENGKLRDSREGFGLLATWNAHWNLISVTLDHVLVTEGIEVINRGVGKAVGSDHLPITIEVGFN